MNLKSITLISFGHFGRDILEETAGAVSLEFKVRVTSKDGHLDLSDFYDSSRRQYNGNYLLKQVDLMITNESMKTLGLFNVDLFIPILTYIFGQAFLGGRSGIASIYRLSNERYGMPADTQLTIDRFKKEVIHELGHTFGLIHCQNPTCVMRSSTYVEDIDQKGTHLCSDCRIELNLQD
jgi:archaemetzincin